MPGLLERIQQSSLDVRDSPATRYAGPNRLGKQEFLKLLIAQLRNQDPLRPMEDREFITQLAQFSALEALENLDQRLEALSKSQALGQAAALIGKQVQARLADGTTLLGLVSEVRLVDGTPRLLVDEQLVAIENVVAIQP